MKILVLVLASSSQPYSKIYREGVSKTYKSISHNDVKIIPYFGSKLKGFKSLFHRIRFLMSYTPFHTFNQKFLKSDKTKISQIQNPRLNNSGELISEFLEIPENVNLRVLEALNWAHLNQEFDVLCHTNVSTYLNIEVIKNYFQGLPIERLYGGVLGRVADTTFVSGACIFLSSDVIEMIVEGQEIFSFDVAWDVALGQFLHSRGIEPKEVSRVELRSSFDVSALHEEDLVSTTNFRCKSGKFFRRDSEIMKELHSRISNFRSASSNY